MTGKFVPGTVICDSGEKGMFSVFRPMILATGGLTLGQVCAITGLEASTVQNWIKRGFVAHPVQKKYYGRQLARILLISALRDSMKIESIGELMAMVNGSADDESDDIISEEKLYDHLCEIIGNIADQIPAIGEIPGIVQKAICDFDPPDPSSKERLQNALTVMVYAYSAGRLIQAADQDFQKMKFKFYSEKEKKQ